MRVLKNQTLPVQSETEVVHARQAVRKWAAELQFSLVDQTKIVTAASEIARNTVVHGKGGSMTIEALEDGGRKGLRLTFADSGPGIADIQLALQDGFSTGSGLGLGLSGAKRLSNEFQISSRPEGGTSITLARWK